MPASRPARPRRRWPVTPPATEIRRRGDLRRLRRAVTWAFGLLVAVLLVVVLLSTRRH